MDQGLGAAIAQHIGDLRLLLARRQQHRHQPGMVCSKHRQREFDTVAEQDRDAVAAVQAEFPKSRRYLRGSPHDLAPVQAPVAANQRRAVRFCAAACAIIAQMLFGRSQKTGTMRSPKRGSSRIAGMKGCDQSIDILSALAHFVVFMS